MKHSRFYSENKFVKWNTNCWENLVVRFYSIDIQLKNLFLAQTEHSVLNQLWIVRINWKSPVSILLVFYKQWYECIIKWLEKHI